MAASASSRSFKSSMPYIVELNAAFFLAGHDAAGAGRSSSELLRGQTAVALGDELVVRGLARFLRITQALGSASQLADAETLLDDQALAASSCKSGPMSAAAAARPELSRRAADFALGICPQQFRGKALTNSHLTIADGRSGLCDALRRPRLLRELISCPYSVLYPRIMRSWSRSYAAG